MKKSIKENNSKMKAIKDKIMKMKRLYELDKR